MATALVLLLTLASSEAAAKVDVARSAAPAPTSPVSGGAVDGHEIDGTTADPAAPSWRERALVGATTGVAAATATLALAALTFSVSVAFVGMAPLLVQLALVPVFPLVLLVPPAAAALAALLAAWPTTDWLGLVVVSGATFVGAVAAFVAAALLVAPVLVGAIDDDGLAPGSGVFELAVLGHVLVPPIAVFAVAGVASALVVEAPAE